MLVPPRTHCLQVKEIIAMHRYCVFNNKQENNTTQNQYIQHITQWTPTTKSTHCSLHVQILHFSKEKICNECTNRQSTLFSNILLLDKCNNSVLFCWKLSQWVDNFSAIKAVFLKIHLNIVTANHNCCICMIEFYSNGTTKLILTHYFCTACFQFSFMCRCLSSGLIATPNGQTSSALCIPCEWPIEFFAYEKWNTSPKDVFVHANWCTVDKLSKVCVFHGQEQHNENNDSSGKPSECDDKLGTYIKLLIKSYR